MDEHSTPSPLPKPNPVTRARHKREVFWQITFPLILVAVVFLALAVLVVWAVSGGDGGSASLWADISTIFLLIPLMVLTLLFTLIVAALAYGVLYVTNLLPPYTRQAHDLFASVENRVRLLADKIAAPFIKIESLRAMLTPFFRKKGPDQIKE